MRCLGIGAILLACVTAQAQNITGSWKGRFAPEDEARQVVLAINAEGGKVTGYLQMPTAADNFAQAGIEGNTVTFVIERPSRGGNPPTQRLTYKAALEGDKLKLTMPVQGNRPPQQYELARVSTEAPKPLPPPPPKISLPQPSPVASNGLAKTPPMGWNSWNKFRAQVSDKMVREIADAMAANGMKEAGYVYVNIDDTWEGSRDANGNITTNSKFPDMKALSDYVHGKGLKLGIYSSPGPKTCAGYEGSYQHEVQDAKTYAGWGIDYLKYDWCSARNIYEASQTTMWAAYAKMGDALVHSGRKIVYSLCQYGNLDVGEWGEKVGGNLWRTTGDIRDAWQSMNNIGFNQQIGREKYAGPGHWNDPDMLEIGNGAMSDTEYQTHMSLWSLLASPLLAGNDLRDVKPAIAAILMNKEVIAVDQDKLGKQGVRVAKDGDLEVWSRPLADGGHAVGLFNRGEGTAKVTALWSDIGVTGTHKIRDLWRHEDLGSMADAYTAEVPSHGVTMIKIAK